jgi:hypothetical protein
MGVSALKLWNFHGVKDEEAKKYDDQNKEIEMARIRQTLKPK